MHFSLNKFSLKKSLKFVWGIAKMMLSLLEKYLILDIGLLDMQISVRLPIKTRADLQSIFVEWFLGTDQSLRTVSSRRSSSDVSPLHGLLVHADFQRLYNLGSTLDCAGASGSPVRRTFLEKPFVVIPTKQTAGGGFSCSFVSRS